MVSQYIPKRQLSVDEVMVPFKGRLSFKQYMPAKPTKWGIKMWAIAEADTGYVSFCEVYSGRINGTAHGLANRVVKSCIEKANVTGQGTSSLRLNLKIFSRKSIPNSGNCCLKFRDDFSSSTCQINSGHETARAKKSPAIRTRHKKQFRTESVNVSVVDKSFDGILGIKFTGRSTEFEFLVFACYLPPENSSRGRDAQSFYAHLLSQIYMSNENDGIYLIGDFNSRIGSLSETLNDIDNLPKRQPLDKSINQHGHELLDFLNEAKFCLLNGRFPNDNFTSISKKGKAVVDYICVPQDIYEYLNYFKVLTIQSIVNDNRLLELIGDKSKLPDHSVVMCEFKVTHHGLSYRIKDQTNCQPRFKLDRIPLDFMASDIRRSAPFEVIDKIERCRETQDNVDKIYDNLCTVILTEMNEKIPNTGYDRANKRQKSKC
ncbi:unnamed protein product [Mytilus coruscus]|uniref:PiggyBac transposable element-derived protein domain-containing protein n=1 Tax=Mytilus coruscus TaxID=42192 RepID=A0A6J8CR47_MYTCO|nr:unnamed protein product [Mytilus coruscus]